MTLSDDQILERAAIIRQNRWEEEQALVRRLYRSYGKAEHCYSHELGKPRKLSMVEALLVAALEGAGVDQQLEWLGPLVRL